MAVRNWSRKSIEDVIRACYERWKKEHPGKTIKAKEKYYGHINVRNR